jgi:hypothetical protein
MHLHLSFTVLLWSSLIGLAIVACIVLWLRFQRLLHDRQIFYLAKDMDAHGQYTIEALPLSCQCCNRAAPATQYLYGDPQREAFLCRRCERHLNMHLEQFLQTPLPQGTPNFEQHFPRNSSASRSRGHLPFARR